jgi:MraZ protein
MFYGQFEHTVDEKGRLIIPSKLRAPLKDNSIEKFYITIGFEKCLFIFAEQEWKRFEEKFKQLPVTREKYRNLARSVFSNVSDVECDKQGRILISKHLMEYASLKKDVMIIGVSKRIEVWDKQSWQAYSQESLKNYEKNAEEVVDFDL